MNEIKSLKEHLKKLTKSVSADYVEIRLEDSEITGIAFQGPKLETLEIKRNFGGAIRALVDSGWSFVSFNNLEELEQKLKFAVEIAKISGRETPEKWKLAEIFQRFPVE